MLDHSPPLTLLRLPSEILEYILSTIESHHDLISLALTSHVYADLVIPRHTQYRIIRIRSPMPFMWAHLARRADLARNIREVKLCERVDYTSPDRYPTTLIDHVVDEGPENAEEYTRIRNMCEALRHMTRLRVFSWVNAVDVKARLRLDPAHEDLVLRALSRAPDLRHLVLGGRCGMHVRGGKGAYGLWYPAWQISGLESLSLRGNMWFERSNMPYVCHMLERSPNLEFLEVPMEFSQLIKCRFPRLKRLSLPLLSGAAVSNTVSRAVFLDNHPTLEELAWFPIGPIELAPSSLPSLKRLKAGRQVLEALEQTDICRSIECLDVWSLDSRGLIQLKNLDSNSLRKLKLHSFGTLDSVHELALRFPSITWLSMPALCLSPETPHPMMIPVETWLDILPRFTNLEVFRGAGLWYAVGNDKQRMHETMSKLVQLCPKLRQLDHCDIYDKRQDYKRIRIIREGPEGEVVRYEVCKPPEWKLLDAMDGTFD